MAKHFESESTIEGLVSGNRNGARRAFKLLTGVTLSERDAIVLWPRVLDHKWYLSERLGRDIGYRVAAVDFVENFSHVRRFHAGTLNSLMRALKDLIEPARTGPSSLGHFESVFRGTRSLAK